MPMYEFRCLKCNEVFEFLLVKSGDDIEMQCPHCRAEDFERVMSTTSYALGSGGDGATRPSVESRQCASGTCSSVTLPGHTKN